MGVGTITKKFKPNWGTFKGTLDDQEDLVGRVGTVDVDESNIGNNRLLVFDVVTGKRVYIDLPTSAEWGAIVGDIANQEDLKLKLEAEKRILAFDSNLDTVALEFFVGSISLISFNLFFEVESISFESALDNGVMVPHASLLALQAWIDLNVTTGTKWILRVSAIYKAGQTNSSAVQLNYNSLD